MQRHIGAHDLTRDIKSVRWRDLAPMRRIEGLVECLHPLPWLLGSWVLAAHAFWPLAAASSFMFFLTALRLNHEAIHGNLGLGQRGHRIVLHALSCVMLGSNSAVAFNHLRHHAHIGTPRDIEGKCGRMTLMEVLSYGPRFPVEMHIGAWREGGRAIRRRMRIDAALIVGLIGVAAVTLAPFLIYHVLAMAMAQCLTAFFAVWITHHDCEHDVLNARTQRSRLINFVTYNMLFHLEHHLFPGVPVKRLGRLAARLDAAVPAITLQARRVI